MDRRPTAWGNFARGKGADRNVDAGRRASSERPRSPLEFGDLGLLAPNIHKHLSRTVIEEAETELKGLLAQPRKPGRPYCPKTGSSVADVESGRVSVPVVRRGPELLFAKTSRADTLNAPPS
jgi:hypothetical protein